MTNEQRVGLFFIGAIILVLLAIELTVGIGFLHKGYVLYAKYPTVEGLRSGDAVQVAGVKLGTVGTVDLQPDGVRVTLKMDDKAVVRRDAVARLESQILGGGHVVAITLGSPNAPALKNGDSVEGELPPDLNRALSDLQGVAQSVRDLADSLNANQDRVLNNINALIEENRNALQRTLDNVSSITAKLDRGDGTLAKLLNDPALYDRTTAVMGDLQQVMGNVQQVTDRISNGQGDLGRLVNSDGALYDDVRETVSRLNVTATNLEEISDRVRNGEGTLGRLATDDSLYQDAQSAVRGLDRASGAIEDQSPISVLGTLITTLF